MLRLSSLPMRRTMRSLNLKRISPTRASLTIGSKNRGTERSSQPRELGRAPPRPRTAPGPARPHLPQLDLISDEPKRERGDQINRKWLKKYLIL